MILKEFILFLVIINLVYSLVPEGGQCGGLGYTGSTQCASGLTCIVVTSNFYQCFKNAYTTTKKPTTTTKKIITTKKPTTTTKKIITTTTTKLATTVKSSTSGLSSGLPEWTQCDGKNYQGSKVCGLGLTCVFLNDYYSQCQRLPEQNALPEWAQCGGINYNGLTNCATGLACVKLNDWYYQCQAIAQTTNSNTVPEWGQCGGIGYNGKTTCASGLTCVYINDYYYQCKKPSSITTLSTSKASSTTLSSTNAKTTIKTSTQSATTKPPSPTGSTTKPQTTTNASNSSLKCNSTFPNGKFKSGISFDQRSIVDLNNYDYITIWINTISNEYGTNYNPWYQKLMVQECVNKNKTAVFYAYVIAFEARYNKSLQDCDVDQYYNLCTHGAEFIRNNRQKLIDRYKHHASNIALDYGKTKPCIFLMEPDFWQYYGDIRQTGGRLNGTYTRDLFNDFVKAIKFELPNALISWDISAWLSEDNMRTWWSFFKNSPIDFINTSGGQSRPDLAQIKPNELGWKFMSTLTGKKIIADCGYGVGGGSDTNCYRWSDVNNLNARITDGVIALSVAYESGVVSRPSLNCP